MGASASAIPPDQQEALRKNTPTFLVSILQWTTQVISLPRVFKLKISIESLDFVNKDDDTPIIQFPFQTVICWGSSSQQFQFKIFNFEESSLADSSSADNSLLISLKTSEGKYIEDTILNTVQNLMKDMDSKISISKQEFNTLVKCLFDDDGQLKEDFLALIDQFTCTGRHFLAKQGMELLTLIKSHAPFEKFDLACLLYNRIVNKESYQLLVNCFDDEQERENLIHRLKLISSVKVTDLSTKCMILAEKSTKSKV